MTDKQDTKRADWERIEAQYSAGAMSLREIAAEHGITEGAIRKRAKGDGTRAPWVRGDLAEKVRKRADNIVRRELVKKERPQTLPPARSQIVAEEQTVEVEAEVQARIRIAHRADITRLRNLALRLIAECEAESEDIESFQKLGDLLRCEGPSGKDALNDAYVKAISLPQRIKGVKELADTLKTLISLEREAYAITELPPPPPPAAVDPVEGARRLAFIFASAANQNGSR